VAAFVVCTKNYVEEPTEGKLKCLKAFATPVLNSFEALEMFAASDKDFAGESAGSRDNGRFILFLPCFRSSTLHEQCCTCVGESTPLLSLVM
jgi:hypothetical protein